MTVLDANVVAVALPTIGLDCDDQPATHGAWDSLDERPGRVVAVLAHKGHRLSENQWEHANGRQMMRHQRR